MLLPCLAGSVQQRKVYEPAGLELPADAGLLAGGWEDYAAVETMGPRVLGGLDEMFAWERDQSPCWLY